MKKVIVFLVLSVFAFTACNQVGGIFEPIVGTWETSILGVTVRAVYNADDTTTETNSLGQVGVTKSGQWSADSDLITVVWDDDSTDEYSYSFNTDKSEMTLERQTTGISITYTRQ